MLGWVAAVCLGCDPTVVGEGEKLAFEGGLARASSDMASGIPVLEGTRWCPEVVQIRETDGEWSGYAPTDAWIDCFTRASTGAVSLDADGCGTVGVGEGSFEFVPTAACIEDKSREVPGDRYVIEGRPSSGVRARWRTLSVHMGGVAWSNADPRWLAPGGDRLKVLGGERSLLSINLVDAESDAIAVAKGDLRLVHAAGPPLPPGAILSDEGTVDWTLQPSSEPTRLRLQVGALDLPLPSLHVVAPDDLVGLEMTRWTPSPGDQPGPENLAAVAVYGRDAAGDVVFGVPVHVELTPPYRLFDLFELGADEPVPSPLVITDQCFEPGPAPREHEATLTVRYGEHAATETYRWTQAPGDPRTWSPPEDCEFIVATQGGCACRSGTGPLGASGISGLLLLAGCRRVRRRPRPLARLRPMKKATPRGRL